MTSVDNVFVSARTGPDSSDRTYNEFMPVSLVLRPYVQELEAAADAHVKRESAADGVTISNGESACVNSDPPHLCQLCHFSGRCR